MSTFLRWLYELPLITVIGTVIIPAIKLFISFNELRQNAKWRCKTKMSSVDLFMKFLVKVCVCGAFLAFMLVAILVYQNQLWNWGLNSNSIYAVSSIITGVFFVFFFVKTKSDGNLTVSSKLKSTKINMCIPVLLRKSVIVIAGIGFTFCQIFPAFSQIFSCIGCVILEILSFFFLDDRVYPEYKYISFLFDDNTMIDKVDIRRVKQKGDWVSISQENEQIKFKITSIKRIKYSNSILDHITN